MFRKLFISLFALVLIIGAIPIVKLQAAALSTGSIFLSDSRISSTNVTYSITFSGVTTSAIQCINVKFSDASVAGSKPSGMTITSLALSGTSTYIPTPGSWGVVNTDATGTSAITFASGETPASASNRTVILTGITNGSVAGTTYFLQFSTYNNTDCTTSPVDSATIAFIYTNGQTVTASVDPTLTFSIAGVASAASVNSSTTNVTTTSTTVPFGTITASTNKIAAQDLSVGTNAGSGYTVTVRYTGILSNGTGGTIIDWTGTNASPTTFSAAGTSAFGYTTEDTTLGTGTAGRFGSNKWSGFTTSPLEVAYSAGAASDTVRVGYQAGISTTTPAGSYTTTVIYTATPIY
ncbi:MAG: hypothetical protein ACMG57_00780 [Candidatus Dojkabacteria bacterium]